MRAHTHGGVRLSKCVGPKYLSAVEMSGGEGGGMGGNRNILICRQSLTVINILDPLALVREGLVN